MHKSFIIGSIFNVPLHTKKQKTKNYLSGQNVLETLSTPHVVYGLLIKKNQKELFGSESLQDVPFV